MADDKKNITPEGEIPTETPAPKQPAPNKAKSVVTDPALVEKATPVDKAEPAAPESTGSDAPEQPKPEKEVKQAITPQKGNPAQTFTSKIVNVATTRKETGRTNPTAKEVTPPDKERETPEQPRRGRPPKEGKSAPDKAPLRDKKSQGKGAGLSAPAKKKDSRTPGGSKAAPVVEFNPPLPERPTEPRDATRPVKEEIVYLDLSELHAFKDHPFEVRDDAEMQALVESVKTGGVNQPALVRPREGGGYEIVAGHRRQKASELAGYRNMPCIVRNMTDDEAILAMTDDNLRHRERILPTEKAQSLKMQVEAIKHQGSRPGEEDKDAGKRSTQVVGDRNGMNYKQVQRYIRLTELVPDLQKMVDEKKLAFTPAVEISFIRPKNQRYIAVSIEGQQSSPSLSQAQKMRELDKDGKLNGDVIDGILSQEKKEVDKVIINSAELEKYFGKDKSPREMKDKIISLLDDWKAKQPPELGKPEKKTDLEK